MVVPLAACSEMWEYTPPTGKVVSKNHSERECKMMMAGKTPIRKCTPESWTIVLDTKNEDEIDLTKEEWENCHINAQYPNCSEI